VTTPLRRRIAPGDDSGATLVFALVIVTVVALVVGAILGFADTSLRTTVALRAQAASAATADGAAQAAINTLRLGTYDNDTSSATLPNCFGTTGTPGTQDAGKTLVLSNLVPGSTGSAANSAAVRCDPDPATGATGGLVPITAQNKPGNAIQTLSTNGGEKGLNVQANSPTIPFNVYGGIVSNSNIVVTNGTLQSNTTVYAHTGCTGTIVSTPAAVCNTPTAADPNYASEATTVPPYQATPAVAAASCPGKIVTFQPGYYDDASALSSLMAGGGANPCQGSVWWFTPGTYYFDFHNSGSHQWLVKDGQLIAGTPTDTSGTVLVQPQHPATVPGACENPITSTTAQGVQFIFGGDSQVQIAGSADAEICGTYHTDRPPIAVYGQKTGVQTPVTLTGASATTVTTDATAGFAAAGGTLASAAAAADGTSDTYTAPSSGGTAHLTLSPYLSGPSLPAGTIVTKAVVRVVYGASDTATNNTSRSVTLTPTDAGGTAGAALPAHTITKSAQAAGTTQSVDVTSDLAPVVKAKGLSQLQVGYGTTMPGGKTERVDAVLVDLTYTVPAFRGETTAAVPGNCLAATYTGTSGGQCAVISTGPSYSGRFYLQGTTYTPLAPIDIALSNITEQVLRFGVVSRVLWLKETGSISYQGPVIEIPDNSPGYGMGDTVIYLSVTVCPGTSTCAYDAAKISLRARVYIHDPTGAPVAGSRQMVVQSWAVQR
jgi:hypothetical protein